MTISPLLCVPLCRNTSVPAVSVPLGCITMLTGAETTIIGVIGDVRRVDRDQIALMDGVEATVRILRPYKLVGRDFHPMDTLVNVNMR